MPGSAFGVAYPALPATVAGLAVGSMVAGIGSILVSILIVCVGAAAGGSALLVAGAFTVLALLLAVGAIVTGLASRREIHRSGGQRAGRGMGTAGLVCGIVGAALTVLGLGVATVSTF